jgi:hypothetical protein
VGHQREGKRCRSMIDVRQHQAKHLRAREAINECGCDAVESGAEAEEERIWIDAVREGSRARRSWE